MNALTKTDLEDITLIFEDLVKRLPKMKRAERIDLAARIRSAGKHIKTIEEAVKAEIKEVLGNEEGTLRGENWKAKLTLVPVNRLDQSLLKEEMPTIHAKYCKVATDRRITFEPR